MNKEEKIMAINKKKPMLKETVGAQYYAFNKPDENGDMNYSDYEDVIKTETVKKIGEKYHN